MKVCVFCSSSNGIDKIYFQDADELGRFIALNNWSLVYGGANVGLMDRLAQSVKREGGTIIGIIPRKIHEHELSSPIPNELIVTETMDERKRLMRDRSDAFVAMPGGFGTLEEILEVITLRQLDYHRKPIVFLNTNGFFNHLFIQFEKSFADKFAKEAYRKLYYIAETPADTIDFLKNYNGGYLGEKWFNVPQR